MNQKYHDFWTWFEKHANTFFDVVNRGENIEKGFLDPLTQEISKINPDLYFLTGMFDDDTTELVITPDGIVQNIVFAEELIKAAPSISNWKFTALKQAVDNIEDSSLVLGDYTFNSDNISFYATELPNHPDQIELVITYEDFKESDSDLITNGVYLFLDTCIGEVGMVTVIDYLSVIPTSKAEKELIPIAKLPSYLTWREKEFVEKYAAVDYDKEECFSGIEGEFHNGNPLIAIMNTELLEWEYKASKPWVVELNIDYQEHESGMPSPSCFELMNTLEDKLLALMDEKENLYLGRTTGNNQRANFWVSSDFRKPSLIFTEILEDYDSSEIGEVSFNIYKDKYWGTFEHFISTPD